MNSGFALFFKQCRREVVLQLRQIRFLIYFCLFFFMIMFIFPLTLKPDLNIMRTIVPGLVWMGVLLAMLLSAERLFQQDVEQGVIEQWLVSGCSLTVMVSAKIFAHWILILLPILIINPLIALLYNLSAEEVWILTLSLLCGSPALLYLCALASVFGMGATQKGALMALILLPLTLPVLILGSGTLTMAMQSFAVSGHLALLLAMSVLAMSFVPYAIAVVIRISPSE